MENARSRQPLIPATVVFPDDWISGYEQGIIVTGFPRNVVSVSVRIGSIDFDGPPEGHHTRYEAAGNLVGITIVSARRILDREGAITVTLPDRVLECRDLGDALTAV